MSNKDSLGAGALKISRRKLLQLAEMTGLGLALGGTGALNAVAFAQNGTTLTLLIPTLGAENWLMPATGLPEIGLLEPMFESLLYRDFETGQVKMGEGRLAERWEMSADAKSFRFTIRKGVPFHGDNGMLGAEDVVYSFQLAMAPEAKNPASSYFRSQIDSVSIENARDVVVAMKQPSPGLIFRLTEMLINFGITCKAYVESAGVEAARGAPVGTGPYRFAEGRNGEYIRFEAVENHWRQTPNIKTLIVRSVPDATARLNLLRSEGRALAAISFDDVGVVQDSPSLKIAQAKGLIACGVQLQGQYLNPAYDPSQTPPWAQPDKAKALAVRRALSLTIDRNTLVEHVLQGYGSTEGAVVPAFFPGNAGFDASIKSDPFEPEKALRILADAGYNAPSELSFTVDLVTQSTRPWNSLLMEAVAQQWLSVGFDVRIQQTDYAAFVDKVIGRRATEAWCYPAPYFDDAAELLSFYTRSTDRLSYTGESVELDELMRAALTAVSADEVAKTRRALFSFLAENIPMLCVGYADQLYATDRQLEWPRPPTAFAAAYFETARYA